MAGERPAPRRFGRRRRDPRDVPAAAPLLAGARRCARSRRTALIAPATIVIVAVLGYPLYFLVRLSFERYGLFQLIAHKGTWLGLDNYTHDPARPGRSGDVVLRTVVFTVVNVGLTMVLGTLIALLLEELSGWVRILDHERRSCSRGRCRSSSPCSSGSG